MWALKKCVTKVAHCFEGPQIIILKKYCISFSEDRFYLANSADLDEMLHYIWVFTVCGSTHLGVSGIKRVINIDFRVEEYAG